MKNIKHIFFDLDHTLWDFEKNSREAILHLYTESNIEQHCNTGFDDFIPVYESINHKLWNLYGLKQTTKEELRYQRFHQAFLHFNYDNMELAKRWADDYLIISPYKTHLIDGAIDVLEYLSEKYTLHLITNGFKEVQHIKLKTSKLEAYFKEVIISEDHGISKPDVKIFELAQSLTNAMPNECLMIGDNFETDITGALNANWTTVHLSPDKVQQGNNNYHHIDHLLKLKEMF